MDAQELRNLQEAYLEVVMNELDEAKAKLKVRSNSDPIRSNWFSHLHDCRYIFQGYLDYLSSMFKEIY